jgi:hypothetical protein
MRSCKLQETLSPAGATERKREGNSRDASPNSTLGVRPAGLMPDVGPLTAASSKFIDAKMNSVPTCSRLASIQVTVSWTRWTPISKSRCT